MNDHANSYPEKEQIMQNKYSTRTENLSIPQNEGFVVIEDNWRKTLATLRYIITQFADESVEVAARAVALAAPLPNAINMFNVAARDLGYHPFAAFAFALTLEIVVFLLVEVALRLWDGYLISPMRYRLPFYISMWIVLVATAIVIGIVYILEPHKIMALLPVVSLCSFIAIGLKRWDERHGEKSAENRIVPEVRNLSDETNSATNERRKALATYCHEGRFTSLQNTANDLSYTSKTVVRNDLIWLEREGIVNVERSGKTMTVSTNGHYESFIN